MFNTPEEEGRINAINEIKIKKLSVKRKNDNIFVIGIIFISFSYLIYDRIY